MAEYQDLLYGAEPDFLTQLFSFQPNIPLWMPSLPSIHYFLPIIMVRTEEKMINKISFCLHAANGVARKLNIKEDSI